MQRPVPIRGDYLPGALYFQDYHSRLQHMTGDSWKLERRQQFVEADSPSWEAAARGDWECAMGELLKRYHRLLADYQRLAKRGITLYRVRIVEQPLTTYLQWQLASQRQRAALGERIRILSPGDIATHEQHAPVPEIITLDTAVYEVHYDDNGAYTAATRSTDLDTVSEWREYIRLLFDQGEPIEEYAGREGTPLSLPSTQPDGPT